MVGASYVALECAGFLTGLGYDTTVLIRSIPLRGFDQEMAHKIVDYMENFCKTKFFHGANPTRIDQVDGERLQVTFDVNGVEHQDTFDTVLWAVGRAPSTKKCVVFVYLPSPRPLPAYSCLNFCSLFFCFSHVSILHLIYVDVFFFY